tara:strand:+ start:1719 stop:2123 length:405 start_codon:yes stop_codon:yes gene_type:complete
MKTVNLILVIFAILFSATLGAKYYSHDGQNSAGAVQTKIDAVTLTAGELALPKADATAWEAKKCSNATDIKSALELDTFDDTFTTEADGVKKGSCCINAHHEVCIAIQAQIKSCAHPGKGENATSSSSAVCPQA